jgi:hypothetical protein
VVVDGNKYHALGTIIYRSTARSNRFDQVTVVKTRDRLWTSPSRSSSATYTLTRELRSR